eukprot:g19346.t1
MEPSAVPLSLPQPARLVSSDLQSVQPLLKSLQQAAAANQAACLEVVIAWKPALLPEDLPPTPHTSHLWFDELEAGLRIFTGPEFYLSLFRFAAATGLRNSVLVRLPTAELFPHVQSPELTRALCGLGGRRALDALRQFLRQPLDRRLAEDCPLITGCVIMSDTSSTRVCARLSQFEFLARCSAADGTFDAGALHRQLELHGTVLVCTEGAHY